MLGNRRIAPPVFFDMFWRQRKQHWEHFCLWHSLDTPYRPRLLYTFAENCNLGATPHSAMTLKHLFFPILRYRRIAPSLFFLDFLKAGKTGNKNEINNCFFKFLETQKHKKISLFAVSWKYLKPEKSQKSSLFTKLSNSKILVFLWLLENYSFSRFPIEPPPHRPKTTFLSHMVVYGKSIETLYFQNFFVGHMTEIWQHYCSIYYGKYDWTCDWNDLKSSASKYWWKYKWNPLLAYTTTTTIWHNIIYIYIYTYKHI